MLQMMQTCSYVTYSSLLSFIIFTRHVLLRRTAAIKMHSAAGTEKEEKEKSKINYKPIIFIAYDL